jgi:hypothetical protein
MRLSHRNFLFEISIIFVMSFYTLNAAKLYSGNIKILMVIGICFGLVGIFVSKNIMKSTAKTGLILLILLGIIFLINLVAQKGNDTRLPVALLTMFFAIDISPRKAICIMFYSKLSTFMLAMLTGGYGHINSVALQGGMIILLYICMREDNLRKRNYLILFVSYIILVLYTRSGSVVIGIGIAILSIFLLKTKYGKNFFSSKFIVWIYPITLIINIILALGIYENKIMWIGGILPKFANDIYIHLIKIIDTYTSSRLQLAHASFERFGVSWLGGNVDYTILWPGVYFNLDSGMIWLLQGGGILMTIFFMALALLLMKYLIQARHYHYVISALVIALWATQEDMLICVGTNFLMIFMGQAIKYSLKGSKYGYTKSNSLLLVRERNAS